MNFLKLINNKIKNRYTLIDLFFLELEALFFGFIHIQLALRACHRDRGCGLGRLFLWFLDFFAFVHAFGHVILLLARMRCDGASVDLCEARGNSRFSSEKSSLRGQIGVKHQGCSPNQARGGAQLGAVQRHAVKAGLQMGS